MFKRKKDVVLRVGKAYEKKKIASSILFIISFALLSTALFGTFQLIQDRLQVEQLIITRKAGTAATAYLQQGTEKNYHTLLELPYISEVGKSYDFAMWIAEKEIRCVVLDSVGYNVFEKPAHSDVIGEYPKNKNEIMLSERALAGMNMVDAKIGMEIPITLRWNDNALNSEALYCENMVISGIYKDYVDDSKSMPTAYFSEAFLNEQEISIYPSDLLLLSTNGTVDTDKFEQRLYKDVGKLNENARFRIKESVETQAANRIMGGYASGVVWAVVILISGYLFIYNLMNMSFNREIKQYGLMEILGCTQKQVKWMIHRTLMKQLLLGIILAVSLSCILAFTVFPRLLSNFFLNDYGNMAGVKIFDVMLLAAVILLMSCIVGIIRSKMDKKIAALAALEAYNYTGQASQRVVVKHASSKYVLGKLAYRNVVNSINFKSTVAILIIWCVVVLAVSIFSNGLDEIHRLRKNPDFTIVPPNDAVNDWAVEDEQIERMIHEDVLQEIALAEKNGEIKVKKIYAGVPGWTFDLLPGFLSDQEPKGIVTLFQVVREQELEQLDRYIKKNQLKIDLDIVKTGAGALFIHNNELSQTLQEQAQNTVGLEIFDHRELEHKIFCAGYLDIGEHDFGFDISQPWYPRERIHYSYLLINEDLFEKFESIGEIEEIFQIDIRVDAKDEQAVKGKLLQLVGEDYLISNSETVEKEWGYIKTNRLLMGVICGALLIIAIFNYTCVLAVNILTREKIFVTMKKLGMTRRQLRMMLILEGVCYAVFTFSIVLTMGLPLLWGAGQLMKNRISYFTFQIPWLTIGALFSGLLSLCIVIPCIMQKISKE